MNRRELFVTIAALVAGPALPVDVVMQALTETDPSPPVDTGFCRLHNGLIIVWWQGDESMPQTPVRTETTRVIQTTHADGYHLAVLIETAEPA